MPLVNRTFDQLIDFTRTSAATFVNSSGNIASTAQSRNLLTFTQEFDNTAWTKNGSYTVPNQNPAAGSLGPELCVNGDFASATGWTVGAGWVVSSGVATATATSSSLYGGQMTTVAGSLYRIDFDVTSYTSGDLAIAIGGNYDGRALLTSIPLGRYTIYLVGGTATTRGVEFYGGVVTCAIDNVSVREVIGGAIIAPDGTPTADKLLESTINGVHNCGRSITTAATAYTFSCYVKAAERTFAFLYHTQSNAAIAINLTTGATATPTGLAAPLSSSATAVGNGWYRLSMTVLATAASNFFGIYTATSLNTISFAGSTTSGIFIWGAQLEQVPDANLTLGSEVVANGDFSGGSTGWATGTGWAIGSGVATATATNSSLISGSAVTAGRTYRVAFDVTSYTAGTLSVRVGTGTARTTTGAGSKILSLTAVDTIGVEFYGGGITLSIDNVSVREITGTTGMPSDYTRNFGGLFPPRFDYDPVTRAPRGLLIEEQRTNLLVRSEEFDNAAWGKTRASVTANATTSPDGTVDADKLVEDTSTNTHFVTQSATVVTSTTYTYSVYLKAAERGFAQVRYENSGSTQFFAANVDLSSGAITTSSFGSPTGTAASATNAGNGWWRVNLTVTASNTTFQAVIFSQAVSGTNSYTGDGTSGIFVYGAQLEAGAFATSYIPTVASQVTRSADTAAINAPNFAPWFNQSAGSFVVEFQTVQSATAPARNIVGFDSSNSKLVIYIASSGTQAGTWDGSAAVTASGSVVSGTPKVAMAYSASDRAITTNGGTVATGAAPAAAFTASTSLNIGGTTGSGPVNGHLRSLRFYPTRLTNAQLQALTA